jgi:hypothetical protein
VKLSRPGSPYRLESAHTHAEQLPPQAIIRDRDTFFDTTAPGAAKSLERK